MIKFTRRMGAYLLGVLAMTATSALAQQYQQQPNQQQYPRQGYRAQANQQQYPRQAYRAQPNQQQYRTEGQYRSDQRTANRSYNASNEESSRQRTMGADHKIAVWMANCNKGEIKLGRYARDRAESSDVRAFADSLVQDHESILRQLERFAPEMANDSSGRNYNQGEQRRQRDSRSVRAWDDATVSQQIADRIVRKARDELSEKEGAEFDHCFVGGQMVSHQQSLAQMEVLRQYASGELRQVIDEAIEIVEGHEAEARDLAKQIREDQGSESSHRVSSRNRHDEEDDSDSDWDTDSDSDSDRDNDRDSDRRHPDREDDSDDDE